MAHPVHVERFRGLKAVTDLVNAHSGEVVVGAGKKITARQAKQLAGKGAEGDQGDRGRSVRQLPRRRYRQLPDRRIYLEAGDEIDEKTLKVLLSTGEDEIEILNIDDVMSAPIRNTLAVDKNESRRTPVRHLLMRPGEPPTLETPSFNSLFFDPERYEACRPSAASR